MSSRYLYFIVLVIILILGVVSFVSAAGDRTVQVMVTGITCASYILWGIMYHIVKKDIHMKVMVEYLLVGLIAFILVMTVLLA